MLLQFKKLFGRCLLAALCCLPGFNQVQGKSRQAFSQEEIELATMAIDGLRLDFTTTELYHSVEDSSKSKVLASILAFPLPFGMMGLHRLYLGANPVIPILYILSFGGVVGILPFIDMMVLVLSRDTKPFYKNSRILMWNRKAG